MFRGFTIVYRTRRVVCFGSKVWLSELYVNLSMNMSSINAIRAADRVFLIIVSLKFEFPSAIILYMYYVYI